MVVFFCLIYFLLIIQKVILTHLLKRENTTNAINNDVAKKNTRLD